MEALLVGLSLGAAAGISPGPLLVLVVTSSLRGGWPAGVLAAAAPLVSDAVIVTGTLLVLDRLPDATLAYIACARGCGVMTAAPLTNASANAAWAGSSK